MRRSGAPARTTETSDDGNEIVKLAEALALRATAVRRVEQLRARIVGNARYQEGEEPSEDAAALLTV